MLKIDIYKKLSHEWNSHYEGWIIQCFNIIKFQHRQKINDDLIS